MGLNSNDISYIDTNGNRITVGTATPLPVTGGGGGGGGSLTQPTTANPFYDALVYMGAVVSDTNALGVKLIGSIPSGTNQIGRVTIAGPSGSTVESKGSGAAASTTDNSLVVQLSPNTPLGKNALPIYSKGASVNTSDDIATAVNATSTNLAAIDAVDFQSVSLHLIGITAYTGTITFEVSNDGTNWQPKNLISAGTGSFATAVSGTATLGNLAVFSGDIGGRYIRARQTAYTSGQIRVVAVLDALSTSTVPQQSVSLNTGFNSIGAVGAQSGTETGSIAALNGTAGGVNDLASLNAVSVQVTGTWVGTLTFQVSNDQTNWISKNLISATLGASTSLMGSNGIYFGHLGARYFRVIATAYTSGTAVVTIRYNAAPGEMPISTVALAGAKGTADSTTGGSIDMQALAGFNNSTWDRFRNALGAQAASINDYALHVATGSATTLSLNAAAAPTAGTSLDNRTARPAHTMQVDITTTTVGTTTHSIVLEGSLDGSYYTTLGTVTPAATSTNAGDPSNHANVSVQGFPYRYVRARWVSISTSWVGTVTARVVSA